MAEYFGIKVEDIFKTQNERFRPDDAKGVDMSVAYDLSGEGGGQWKVTVKDLAAKTEKIEGGDFGKFTAKIVTDAETFAGVTLGKIDGMEAFTSGKVRVEGDMSVMALLPRLFVKFVPPKKGVSAWDILSTAPERFRPDQAEGLDARIGYDLAGEGGGKWTAIIKGGKCEMVEGLSENLTVNNIVSAKDYVDLMTGKLDPLVAFGAGRLRLTGDMELAQRLPKIFAKFVPPQTDVSEELIVLKKTISVKMKYSTGPIMGKFFEGLMEKKIYANECPQCGRKQLPPREVCAICRCKVEKFVEVGPEGVLTRIEDTYYASPDPLTGETRETPYGSIHLVLDGCKGMETFWHTLKKEDLFDVKRDDRVRPVWNDKRVGSVNDILYFEKVR